MQISKLLRMFIIFALILANYGCDQVTKSMARKQIPDNERIEVIGERFILTKAENTGMMLGSGSNLDPTAKTIIVYILPADHANGVLFFLYLISNKAQSSDGVRINLYRWRWFRKYHR